MLDIALSPKSEMSDSERMQLMEQYERQLRERQSLMSANIREYNQVKNRRTVKRAMEKISKNK